MHIKETKTAKSRRRIDLSAETLAVLQEHRKAMLTAGFVGGPVFCDTQGGYLRSGNVRRDSFAPIPTLPACPCARPRRRQEEQEEGGPDRGRQGDRRGEGFRLYDLRHTCATLLLLADVPAKIVCERLGHSSITLTLDTYSHVLPTMQKRAADVFGKLLGRAGGGQAEGG